MKKNVAQNPAPQGELEHIQFFGPEDIPQVAPEVADMIAETARETLGNWFEHIGAPDAAKTLLEAISVYGRYEGQCDPERNAAMNFEAEFLPMALNAIAEMGGQWSMGLSSTNARPMPEMANGPSAPTVTPDQAGALDYSDSLGKLQDVAQEAYPELFTEAQRLNEIAQAAQKELWNATVKTKVTHKLALHWEAYSTGMTAALARAYFMAGLLLAKDLTGSMIKAAHLEVVKELARKASQAAAAAQGAQGKAATNGK
jgi:hypothetical protein